MLSFITQLFSSLARWEHKDVPGFTNSASLIFVSCDMTYLLYKNCLELVGLFQSRV